MKDISPAPAPLTPEAIAEALVIVQDVFRQVRPLILKRAGKVGHTDKLDGSPVTDTDVEVENIVLAELAQHFPDVPVFGEETGYADDLPAICWLVDPIDGTGSFIQNIPAFTTMAVLIQGGEALASVIYNPSTNSVYTAQKGRGAYKNGVRLDLQQAPLAPTALCKGRFIDALNALLEPKGVTCQVGESGAGHGFSLVAEGLAAARFNLLGGGYIHDYAPGALLVREAGGAIIPIKEDIYTYTTRSFIACHPALELLLRQHIPAIRSLEINAAAK